VNHRGLRLCLAAAAMTGLLGGCVAVAIPVIAGGMLGSKVVRDGKQPKVPAPVTASAPERAPERAYASASAASAAPGRADLPSGASVQVTQLRELPAPTPAAAAPLPDFATYALEQTRPLADGQLRSAAVLTDDSTLIRPRLRPCRDLAPAVVLDLDPGTASFDPAASGTASPGLPESLAALRAAGVTVMWASSLPVDQAQAIYQRLHATNLDPGKTDRLLLQRKPDERKQVRLRAAARVYCIVAMTGDLRSDFDELYDYLRDPGYAIELEKMFGAGWFLVPPPIQ
jgi:hypothetical protein